MDRSAIEQIAADLGAKPGTIRQWRIRQVPYKWRLLIEDEAKRRKLAIDRKAFERQEESQAAWATR